ncbi:amidohydrolase family protein [Aerococcus urinae]|uniref:amidohydrolase family protein n=1 Tax=Aerococcus urinae TaxID=1376 RepID=UPI0025519D41|nr:amidohydrolase family protein [Aerococcus urinae]MDK6371105.1 amidohydrolase family protein [Aerococcus urinae]
MKKFDAHVHFGPTSSGEEVTLDSLLKEFSEYSIEKAGVSCLSGVSMEEQNHTVYQLMKEAPNFIIGYAFINPKDPLSLSELEKCLSEYHMKGVKFHSWKHGYYPDNRPELDSIFKVIEKYNVHVQMHVGTAPLSTPYIWGEYARKFPNIDFVFTHTGYYEFGLSAVEIAKKYKNIYLETSGQMDIEVLKKAIKELGTERIIFGTDWPYKPVNVEVEKFNHLGLKDKELEQIFYKNISYLWRL